ncbi:helix-turn-helix domain-containing protein [Chitinophaga nivalis]|uniref:Helix-turn-helix transcriptional regulator n=1 Tax=Chitinophaga nivalis TaxID=2991709 RepID=A0ABT3IMC1_9BACT|nr:helix-turn-helix transcriptional regulator [Chitinophaga nivalis]MCW3465206.1 helix-turn-helix transcriptional regulator [Chitinophaga nivalis]MCW3485102.1 helix-turn-helix transcriptional regulator [Chitinophaga nivalis]
MNLSMKEKKDVLLAFGKRLQQLREARKLTQMDLAVHIETYPNYISRLENGKSEPGLMIMIALADALGVCISELTGTDSTLRLDNT